jgi:hypothetical protein
MKKISSLALMLISLFCLQATAQQAGAYDEAKEAEIAVKAKKRLYPGGKDEEDLKVQSQLVTPARKFAPQTEIRPEPESEE